MKIALDKNTITLAKKEDALQYATENTWIDKETLACCAAKVLRKYYNTQYTVADEIISMPKLEVVYNDCLGFCIYANDMIVKYWHKDEGDLSGFKMACLSFSVTDCINDRVSAYVQIFGNTDSRVI